MDHKENDVSAFQSIGYLERLTNPCCQDPFQLPGTLHKVTKSDRQHVRRGLKPLPNLPNDNIMSAGARDINFSRKREPITPSIESPIERHGSKRKRQTEPSSRRSRFREETMNDKPSQKPPSVFLRALNGIKNASTTNVLDHLMEEYHENTETEDTPPGGNGPSPTRATQLSGLTHHPNLSIASSAAMSVASKESSIYRFSRNVASTINPVKVWQKVTAKKPKLDDDRVQDDTEMVERQIRAEQAYAQLKSNGQLGTLGTRTPSKDYKILTPGYTTPAPDTPRQQPGGGVDMMEDIIKHSLDLTKTSPLKQRMSATPGKRSGSLSKKISVRTPSFHDLKKSVSAATLTRRNSSANFTSKSSDNLTAMNVDESEPGLRYSRSKRDLSKAAKLNRRISDLEAKLEDARQAYAVHESRSTTPNKAPSLQNGPSSRTVPRRFNPLPTLPSESLLNASEEQTVPSSNIFPSRPSTSSIHGRPSISISIRSSTDSLVPSNGHAGLSQSTHSTEATPHRRQHRVLRKTKSASQHNFQSMDDLLGSHPSQSPSEDQHKRRPDIIVPTEYNPPAFNLGDPALLLPDPSHHMPHILDSVAEESRPESRHRNEIAPAAFSKIALASPPLIPAALPRPRGSKLPSTGTRRTQHGHSRSMSPPKGPETYRDRDDSSVPKLRKRGSSRLKTRIREDEDAVWIRPDGVDVPPLPCQVTPDKDVAPRAKSAVNNYEWPEDVF